MVKVIEAPKQVRCKKCGALLEYELKDVHTHLFPPCIEQRYIYCPCCGNDCWID